MTEVEWVAATDPMPMLAFLRHRPQNRKLRLFACACCTPVVASLWGCEFCLQAVETAECYADGRVTDEGFASAREHAHSEWMNLGDSYRYLDAVGSLVLAAANPIEITWLCLKEVERAAAAEGCPEEAAALGALSRAQPDLLRCIFGNPFRPVDFAPEWRTEAVVGLARGVYANRAFDRLPVLADALEDAGCSDPDVLRHCRGPGPHVRGCWVVDACAGWE